MNFQQRVAEWMKLCFTPEVARDITERGDRLLEEVFELLQSGGYDPSRVITLRDYTWSRPVGVPKQEVGGVRVTLSAYCSAVGVDEQQAAEDELTRIHDMIPQIRAKQASKRGLHTPLPVAPYAAVVCMGLGGGIPACGKQDLTKEQYDEQMKYPDRGWRCPQCRADAWFDDERFEQLQGIT